MVLLGFVTLGATSSGSPDVVSTRILAAAAAIVAFAVPITAALAAWSADRLHRADVPSLAPDRSPLIVQWRSLSAPFVSGAVAAGLVQLVAVRTLPTNGAEFLALLMPYWILAAFAAAGHALGMRLHVAFSVPLAAIGSWFVLVYPISIEPLWMRHLTGYVTACCETGTSIQVTSIVAPMLIASAVVALVATSLAATTPRRILGGLGAALVAYVAVLLVQPLGSEASVPRDASELDCSDHDGLEICLWPEHDVVRRTAAERASTIRDALDRAGVDVPARITERPEDGDWAFGTHREAIPEDIDVALIAGLLPETPDCSAVGGEYLAGPASVGAVLLLADLAGVEESVAPLVSPDERDLFAPLLDAPTDAQRMWLGGTLSALTACDVAPPAIPSATPTRR